MRQHDTMQAVNADPVAGCITGDGGTDQGDDAAASPDLKQPVAATVVGMTIVPAR